MQILADVTGRSFEVLEDPRNSGALGAAVVAMIGLGHLSGFSDVKQFVKVAKKYNPDAKRKAVYDELFEDYRHVYYDLKKAYEKSNGHRFTGTM
jgi:xylulokinase